ncbi:hypothetical protein BDZ97DRAFT_1751597 [Flammula alnicola]|nr:hypothetical protein BDZ97DRAFT_1751597 [Flammula alnicola]
MSDDAFPIAEQIFRDALALPDPAPALLDLIKAHPTYAAVSDLLVSLTDVVEETPSRAEVLSIALVTVRDSPDAPTINGDTLVALFSRKLADLLSRGFELDDDAKTFAPTNRYLATSLLSGLAFKYGLTSSPDQYGNITNGLDARPDPSAYNSEVLVVGACIQLLTNGSGIIPAATSYIKSVDEVVLKLKAQKSAATVKDPNALKLLELAISHAESGFQKANDVDNVWEILFPPQK